MAFTTIRVSRVAALSARAPAARRVAARAEPTDAPKPVEPVAASAPPPAAATPTAMPVTVSEGVVWSRFAGEEAQGGAGRGQTKPPTWNAHICPNQNTHTAHPRRPQGRPRAVVHW